MDPVLGPPKPNNLGLVPYPPEVRARALALLAQGYTTHGAAQLLAREFPARHPDHGTVRQWRNTHQRSLRLAARPTSPTTQPAVTVRSRLAQMLESLVEELRYASDGQVSKIRARVAAVGDAAKAARELAMLPPAAKRDATRPGEVALEIPDTGAEPPSPGPMPATAAPADSSPPPEPEQTIWPA